MANVTYSGQAAGPTTQNPYQGPAGTTGMAQAYLNFQNSGGNAYPGYTSPESQGQYTKDGKLTSFLPGGSNYRDESQKYSASGGGSGGGLWSGGGSTGALKSLTNSQAGQMRNLQVDTARRQNSIIASIDTLIRGGLGDTSAIYKEAMQNAINQIDAGMQQAQQSTQAGLNIIGGDLQSTLDALSSYRDTARGDISAGYEAGLGALESGRSTARADLEQQYGGAIDRYNVLSVLVPEAIGNYRDQVLEGFDKQFQDYQQSDAYQFALNEGLKAIQAQAASSSGTDNSTVMKAMQRYASDYASQNYMAYQQQQYGQAQDYLQTTLGGLSAQSNLQSQLGNLLASNEQTFAPMGAQLYVGRGQDLSAIEGQYASGQQQAYQTRSQLATALQQQQAALQAQAGAQRANFAWQGGTGSINNRAQNLSALAALAQAGLSI